MNHTVQGKLKARNAKQRARISKKDGKNIALCAKISYYPYHDDSVIFHGAIPKHLADVFTMSVTPKGVINEVTP